MPNEISSPSETAGAPTRRPLTRPPAEYIWVDDSTAIVRRESAEDPVVTEGLVEKPSSRGASTFPDSHRTPPPLGAQAPGRTKLDASVRQGGNAGPGHLPASPAEGHTVSATADGTSAAPSLAGGSAPPAARAAPTPASGEGKCLGLRSENRRAGESPPRSLTHAEETDAFTVTDTDVASCGGGSRNALLEAELARVVERAEQRWRPDHPLYALIGVTSAEQAGANAAASFNARTSYGVRELWATVRRGRCRLPPQGEPPHGHAVVLPRLHIPALARQGGEASAVRGRLRRSRLRLVRGLLAGSAEGLLSAVLAAGA